MMIEKEEEEERGKGVNGMLIEEREALRRKFKEKHRDREREEREQSRKGIWVIYINISDQTKKPKQQKTRERFSLIQKITQLFITTEIW